MISVISIIITDYLTRRGSKFLVKLRMRWRAVSFQGFAALKTKMYSVKALHAEQNMIRAKGVSRAAMDFRHSNYLDVLTRQCIVRKACVNIRSINYELFTVESNKIALNAFDDKRFYLPDGKSSLAYGHKNIRKEVTE